MALTLQTAQILDLSMDAFKVHLPFLTSAFASDFSGKTGVLGQDCIARIAKLPTTQDYDAANGGYANGATAAESLFEDVPVTINQHKHVPVDLDYLVHEGTVDEVRLEEATANLGYVLAKSIADYCLGLASAANFSKSTTAATANVDLDTLRTVRGEMNKVGANAMGRFGIVNTDVMSALDSDSRIASGDYHGQRIGGSAIASLVNLQGFGNIWEYPDMPANGENITGLFATPRSIVLATRIPRNNMDLANALGIPQVSGFETMTDPDSGLTLLGIKWIEQGTQKVQYTVTLMWGAVAGKQGGAAGDKTDYAGHLLKSS
jgi:hypothetical protein